MEQQPSPQGRDTASEDARHSAEAAEHADKLRASVTRGSVWTLVGYGIGQTLRLLNNLILWRLLYPEAFGLMSLVSVFLVGINLFSDIGIAPSIVQNKRGDDPTFLNTAWTIQVVREFLLCIVAFLLAIPVAAFYKQPQLAQLIPAAALSSLFCGFNSTRMHTLTRKLALGRLTMVELASQALGLAVMIVVAWIYRSVWALIIGTAFTNLIRLVLSHTVLPGIRNRFCWDATSARGMMHFGKWIFLSTILCFLATQSDRVIFGKLIPIGYFGVYSIAIAWVSLPTTVTERLFGAVLFPLLSRSQGDIARFSVTFVQARRPWLLFSGWAAAGLAGGGPTLIRLLYESRATDAGWIIQVMAIGVWFTALYAANGTAVMALGHSRWVAIGNAAKVVGIVAFIPLGYKLFGFPGAVAGYAGAGALHYIASVVGVRRFKVKGLREDLALTSLTAATSFLGLFAARWLVPWLGIANIRPAKLGVFLEGIVIAVCVSLVWGWIFLSDRAKKRRQASAAAG